MDDGLGAGHSAREARGVRDVALGEVAAPPAQPGRLASVTHETADRQVAATELVDDVASHEARAARDQNHPVGSF